MTEMTKIEYINIIKQQQKIKMKEAWDVVKDFPRWMFEVAAKAYKPIRNHPDVLYGISLSNNMNWKDFPEYCYTNLDNYSCMMRIYNYFCATHNYLARPIGEYASQYIHRARSYLHDMAWRERLLREQGKLNK